MKYLIFPTFFILLLSLSACKSSSGTEGKTQSQVAELVKTYENGEVMKCQANEKVVYTAQLNINDAETMIYDETGTLLGSCFYSVGVVDPICREVTDCTPVYRVKDNIWGKPAVSFEE